MQSLREDVKLDPVAEALARLIVRMPDRLLPKMHFEGDFCIGCDWRRINLTESSKVLSSLMLVCSLFLFFLCLKLTFKNRSMAFECPAEERTVLTTIVHISTANSAPNVETMPDSPFCLVCQRRKGAY